jgi:hypothetical protein
LLAAGSEEQDRGGTDRKHRQPGTGRANTWHG